VCELPGTMERCSHPLCDPYCNYGTVISEYVKQPELAYQVKQTKVSGSILGVEVRSLEWQRALYLALWYTYLYHTTLSSTPIRNIQSADLDSFHK